MAAGTLLAQARGNGVSLFASGAWTAEYARTLEPLVEATVGAKTAARSIAIDVAQIERIDTYGAWLIERTLRTWRSRGVETRLYGLPDRHRGLFEKVQAGTHKLSPLPRKSNSIISTLESVGRTMSMVVTDVLLLFQMGGALTLAFLRVLVRPHTFRFTSMVKHLERVGWNAVPIILMITLLIGAIIAQQGIFHFRTFGADIYVVDMVGVLILRELGVVIVCIMVAGRSGSAYTAELGSMKMREEVDALRTMGFDPVEVLILPRILALMIAVPLLNLPWLDGRAIRRRPGGLALRRHKPSRVHVAPARRHFAADFRSRHDQSAIHGADNRPRFLCRGVAGSGQRQSHSAPKRRNRWLNQSSSSSWWTGRSPYFLRRLECSDGKQHPKHRDQGARFGGRFPVAPCAQRRRRGSVPRRGARVRWRIGRRKVDVSAHDHRLVAEALRNN